MRRLALATVSVTVGLALAAPALAGSDKIVLNYGQCAKYGVVVPSNGSTGPANVFLDGDGNFLSVRLPHRPTQPSDGYWACG